MSKLDTNHVVNLDLVKDRVNSVIKFGLADVETSDFYLGLYNNGSRVFDKDYIVTLYIVKPNGTFRNIELKPIAGLKKYYCNLPDTLKNIPGEYVCQAMIFDNLTGEKKISKSKFKYSVSLDLASEMAGIIDEEEQESILTNILNRLLTLENPVEPYATQKHVDECVSTLTEEIDTIKVKDTEQDGKLSNIETKNIEQDNRLTNIESKNTEQDNRLTSIEAKDVEQDGRLDSLENKVDGIDKKIVDTIEPSLDNYGNRLDTLETKDIAHELRMTNIESKNAEQDNRLTSLESKDLAHESRMTDIESKNIEQDNRLNTIETKDTEQDGRLDVAENRLANIGNDITNTMQPIIDEHTSRLDAIEAIDVAQNTRLDAIEVKNQQQDDRLLDIEKVNKRQDMNLKCLFAESKNNMIDITEEGNSIYLQNSTTGYTLIDEIKGNTLVNCNKEPDKELILNGNINTSADNTVTITEGVDGGLVDVALEGNTLVNVSKTKDSTAITKAYTVENSGNHIALQGDVDGSCRPVITGKTLVNIATSRAASPMFCKEGAGELNLTQDLTNAKFIGDGEYSQGLAYYLYNVCTVGNTYTLICEFDNSTTTEQHLFIDKTSYTGNEIARIAPNTKSHIVHSFTMGENYKLGTNLYQFKSEDNYIAFNNIIILEGDYTGKPIPDYFTGLQSTFEDNLVTQEMVDSGEEVVDNLGKYKVEYKVTGKNKFDINKLIEVCSNQSAINITTNNNNSFTIQSTSIYSSNILVDFGLDMSKQYSIKYDNSNGAFTITQVENGFNFYISPNYNGTIVNLQIEEGSTSTTYEPHKEYTKTFYLNSPLLEGDTIEEKNGGIYHVHRSNKMPVRNLVTGNFSANLMNNSYGITWLNLSNNDFKHKANTECKCDNIKTNVIGSTSRDDETRMTSNLGNANQWRILNKELTTVDEYMNWINSLDCNVVYKLASPTYELIEQDNLAIPSYANGHLDFNTAVPVEKVDFLPFSEELTYLYANTQYTVQFLSDKAITVDITLGGTKLLAQSIVKGLNRITITTPETLVDNKLVIDGVGANISEVVVTDTDREFGYFEGMKSVGECEELEVKSGNKNLFDYNKFCEFVDERKSNNPNGYYYHGFKIKVKPNTYYKFSREDDSGLGLGCYIVINDIENDYKSYSSFFRWIAHSTADINNSEGNFNTENRNYIYINTIFDSDTSNDIINNMKKIMSTFQLEEGSVATDYIPHQSNIQQLTHEPLRAVGDAKDRYVLIDGKWYIERNCGGYTFTGNEEWRTDTSSENIQAFITDTVPNVRLSSTNIISNIYPKKQSRWSANELGFDTGSGSNFLMIYLLKSDASTIEELRNYLSNNEVSITYELQTPVYEPIDYNPLEVYSGTTHITTNSTIPTNITVKNHGFNCLLKPSTTYTISSNLGLNTVTTPSVLTEDCLRFMDTDTSDVTTMRDVLVLEGDWTTKADLIPANFSGIESAFEQEYDAEKGKYKVNVKVANEDRTQENNITFYINEPLRGIENVKDRVYVRDDKVVVERNCKQENMSELEFAGDTSDTMKCLILFKSKPKAISNIFSNSRGYESATKGQMYVQERGDGMTYLWIPTVPMSREEFTNFLNEKNATIVYPRTEPTYEEVEYNDVKLFIESFKNSTLSYNSNVPVTSKLYYSYSVPIVDTVAQTANVTDQQDSMIIDLATQCAVMEIMLM